MSVFINKFVLFIQYVVTINVVNYPELFRQTQFIHCRVTRYYKLYQQLSIEYYT